MKVYVKCNSSLTSKTLENYLRDLLSTEEHCDFIIADSLISSPKPVCLISFEENSNITRPFYKDSLLEDLEHFFSNIGKSVFDPSDIDTIKNSIKLIESLDNREAKENNDIALRSELENIVQDFTEKLYHLIKDKK